jgi:putative spermidine/putrescine transport system permease protein
MMKNPRERDRKRKVNFLILPVLVIFIAVFLYPLVQVIMFSFFDPAFTLESYVKFFSKLTYGKIFFMTFRLGITVTVSCMVLGYPVAYVMSHVKKKLQNLIMILVIVPFWTSLLVRTYAWMVLLQRRGLLNSLLMKIGVIDEPLKLMYNTFGVNVGMINILLPFMIITLYGVMKGIDKNLIKAAQNLGATPFKAFLRVFFPLSLPGVTGGALLVFVISIGFYITPSLMGGLKDITVSILIENIIVKLLDWGFASAIAFILLIVTLGLIFLYNHFLGLDRLLGGEGR